MMPSRPLSVRSAIFSPPGIEISTVASPARPYRRATSPIAASIIRRGAGLIAGSPGGSGRPARVTVPIPSPARNTTPDPGCPAPQKFQFEPVIWQQGEIQQLPTIAGDPDGVAEAINDNGQIVGISGTCDTSVGAFSAMHALLWENGGVINLGNLGGQGWNTPMAINHHGDVIVGFSDLPGDVAGGVLNPNFHAFIWTKASGKMTDIGVLPGDSLSEALDVNDQGQVVGVSLPSFHAFIYEDGKMFDLNSLIPKSSPLLLIAANGINENGEITGQACIISDGGCPLGANIPAFLASPNY